jgi:hypothetical protein
MAVEPYQAEGVPSGLQSQDLARCYGWKFPAHAKRGRKPGKALRANVGPLNWLLSIAGTMEGSDEGASVKRLTEANRFRGLPSVAVQRSTTAAYCAIGISTCRS